MHLISPRRFNVHHRLCSHSCVETNILFDSPFAYISHQQGKISFFFYYNHRDLHPDDCLSLLVCTGAVQHPIIMSLDSIGFSDPMFHRFSPSSRSSHVHVAAIALPERDDDFDEIDGKSLDNDTNRSRARKEFDEKWRKAHAYSNSKSSSSTSASMTLVAPFMRFIRKNEDALSKKVAHLSILLREAKGASVQYVSFAIYSIVPIFLHDTPLSSYFNVISSSFIFEWQFHTRDENILLLTLLNFSINCVLVLFQISNSAIAVNPNLKLF